MKTVTDHTLWKLEKYARELNALALDIAQEAAHAGRLGRGMAVVADETEDLSEGIYAGIEFVKFNVIPETRPHIKKFLAQHSRENMGNYFERIVWQNHMLAINAMVIAIQANLTTASVFADTLHKRSKAITKLFGYNLFDQQVSHELAHPYQEAEGLVSVILCKIGEHYVVEKVDYLQEILYVNPEYLEAADQPTENIRQTLNLRGKAVPVLFPHQKLNCTFEHKEHITRGLVLWYQEKLFLAVVDEVLDVLHLPLGMPVACKTSGIKPELIRTAWDKMNGTQHLFLNWERFLTPEEFARLKPAVAQ